MAGTIGRSSVGAESSTEERLKNAGGGKSGTGRARVLTHESTITYSHYESMVFLTAAFSALLLFLISVGFIKEGTIPLVPLLIVLPLTLTVVVVEGVFFKYGGYGRLAFHGAAIAHESFRIVIPHQCTVASIPLLVHGSGGREYVTIKGMAVPLQRGIQQCGPISLVYTPVTLGDEWMDDIKRSWDLEELDKWWLVTRLRGGFEKFVSSVRKAHESDNLVYDDESKGGGVGSLGDHITRGVELESRITGGLAHSLFIHGVPLDLRRSMRMSEKSIRSFARANWSSAPLLGFLLSVSIEAEGTDMGSSAL